MKDTDLFQMALGLVDPWFVESAEFDPAKNRLDIRINFKRVGLDETLRKRGHNYVTLFVDMDSPRVLLATEGKDAGTVETFKQDLIEHGGSPESITEVCCDMSPSFISGVERWKSIDRAEWALPPFSRHGRPRAIRGW
jgi:transposase